MMARRKGVFAREGIMSIAAIAGNSSQISNIQNQYQQVRNQFKQLGQDLASGNLTQAETDFVTLSQSAASQFSSSSPVGQALNSIGQALQSGNLSAAQQAFASLTKVAPNAVHHHSHVPPTGNNLTQDFNQLGQALQSGNLSAAQQAFAAIQQVWQQMSGTSLTPTTSAAQTTSATSISA
jgi:hypothetical protein